MRFTSKEVGAVSFIKRLSEKRWDTVVTVQELSSHFLMEETFKKSFSASRQVRK
jgi:hypothetical protein